MMTAHTRSRALLRLFITRSACRSEDVTLHEHNQCPRQSILNGEGVNGQVMRLNLKQTLQDPEPDEGLFCRGPCRQGPGRGENPMPEG